jgi:galactonate dehydratase
LSPEIFLTRGPSARKLGVPIYQLLGGKLRDKLKVYAWIGGDRPGDVEAQA